MNEIEIIKAELTRAANTLANAGKGEIEKEISVTFGDDKNAIRIDSTKFIQADGTIIADPKAISIEKGRLITKSELSRSIAKDELNQLQSEGKNLQSLFKNVCLKNATEQVKSDWCGFSNDVDNFINSLPVPETENPIEQITNDWVFNKLENPEVKNILDELQDTLKSCPDNRISTAKEYLERLKKIIEINPEAGKGEAGEGEAGEGEAGKGEAGKGEAGEGETGKGEAGEGEAGEGEAGKGEAGEGETGKGEAGEGEAGEGEAGEGEAGESEAGKPKAGKSKAGKSKDGKSKDGKLADKDLFDIATEEPKADNTLEKKSNPTKESYVDGDPFVSRTATHPPKINSSIKTIYKRTAMKLKKQIEVIRNSFAFRNNNRDRYNVGQTMGDLDQNGLHKFAMNEINLFAVKELAKGKKITIGILLDQSGSMLGNSRDCQAREVVIALIEALKTIKGIDLVVYGHTADLSERSLDMIPYQDKAAGQFNLEALSTAHGLCENHDGFAIRFMGKRMVANNPIDKDNIHKLFVITDGVPYGHGYHDYKAINHTASCVNKLREAGVEVYAIGIDEAFEQEQGISLFGKNNFVILKDVKSSLAILARQIKNLFSK